MPDTKFDLSKAIFDLIEELGADKAAAFFGKTASTIAKWQGGTAVPDVAAAQKVLDKALDGQGLTIPAFATPPPQGVTKPDSIEQVAEKAAAQVGGKAKPKVDPEKAMDRATKYDILIPVHREMSDAVVQSILGNWKATLPKEIRPLLSQLHFIRDTLIHRARNLLATRFMHSGNEWSFWMDSDIIAPIGNPKWYTSLTRKSYKVGGTQAALERLTSRGKSFVAAVYSERNAKCEIIASPGLAGSDAQDKKIAIEVKKGPQDKVVPIQWAGFGCVAVHRKVFEDIVAKVPDVKPKDPKEPFHFFTAFEGGPQGEDVAFAKRAAMAGHQCFLDLSVFCGHVGKFCYMPA